MIADRKVASWQIPLTLYAQNRLEYYHLLMPFGKKTHNEKYSAVGT